MIRERRAGPASTDSLLAALAVPPWPARDGYSLRAGRLLAELAERWSVTAVSPEPTEASPREAPDGIDWQRVAGVPATNMLPWRDERQRFADAVASTLAGRTFRGAVLWNGTEYLADEVEGFPPAVGDRIDCGALQAWRKLKRGGSLRKWLQQARHGLEMAGYERRVLPRLVGVVAAGPDDAAALERLTGHSRVEVVPNGVELPRLDRLPDEDEAPTVIFTGVMSYTPNVDAASWFTEAVWPEVRRRVPDARFVIAGRSPLPEVKALQRTEGVVVHADVPDLSAEIRRAWVAVAPMKSGSGIKNKVLEAWAVERPVVLTELATNGLALDRDSGPGQLVCGDGDELAEKVSELLGDHDGRRELGRASRALARERHSWRSAGDSLARVLAGFGFGGMEADAPRRDDDLRPSPPSHQAGREA